MLSLLENASKRRPYPIGKVNGALANIALDDPQVESSSESEEDPTEYEQEFVKAELSKYATGPSQATSGFGEDVVSIAKLASDEIQQMTVFNSEFYWGFGAVCAPWQIRPLGRVPEA